MSDIVFYFVAGLVLLSFLITLVFLFCVIIFRENKKYLPESLAVKNYPKVSFLNALSRI